MTTIAWDGKTLAGDKLCSYGGLSRTATKVFKVRDHLVGAAGDMDLCTQMRQWFANGAKPEEFPERQRKADEFVTMVVISPTGGVYLYEREPTPFQIEDKFFATGSGRDFATTALHLGYSAAEAVKIAIEHDLSSGLGVDTVTLDEQDTVHP